MVSEVTARYARRLRVLRTSLGLSAQNLADSSGVPRAVLTNLENGRRERFSLDEAVAIAEALGTDLDAMTNVDTERFVDRLAEVTV